jgi:succinate dehydrogenase / fumarate reductase membrane anchor subunit
MRAWVASPVTFVLLIVTFAATFWHAAMGGHEVIEDYVHGSGARSFANLANRLFNLALAVLSIGAVLIIAFGG